MSYKEINYIPNDIECFLIKDNRAYFTKHENDLSVQFTFKFNNVLETKSFKIARDIRNLKQKKVEQYMAVDENGIFCYEKYNTLKKSLGLQPSPPTTILDLQAQKKVFALYLDLDHEQEIDLLLMNVEANYKNRNSSTLEQSTENSSTDERLRQLCDRFKVDHVFANVFLNEIKSRYEQTNQLDEETNVAIILGLLKK